VAHQVNCIDSGRLMNELEAQAGHTKLSCQGTPHASSARIPAYCSKTRQKKCILVHTPPSSNCCRKMPSQLVGIYIYIQFVLESEIPAPSLPSSFELQAPNESHHIFQCSAVHTHADVRRHVERLGDLFNYFALCAKKLSL
jgi:hypothetical protein